ncbi:MAG: aminotransferase class V-fold PLP-dependent enzyme [Pseudomonadota bacterium]
MTGLDGRRVYLDWNATAPLRPEARSAMLEAMDTLGNPSSVHAEGRAARAIVERARADVSTLVSCEPDELVFTSGATEAAQRVIFGSGYYRCSVHLMEHDAVEGASWFWNDSYRMPESLADDLQLFNGLQNNDFAPDQGALLKSLRAESVLVCMQHGNSETGVISDLPQHRVGERWTKNVGVLRDITQSVGRVAGPYHLGASLGEKSAVLPQFLIASCHKLGGCGGIGAMTMIGNAQLKHVIKGGGQEQGRRSGTENVVGIAGFGAAAVAAKRDLEAGVWDRVEKLRNILEEGLEAAAPDLIIFGSEASRLPNTSCFAVPGWKGETQVMQLDLAGFAVSAGSACSSGKVKESRVLRAMGFDSLTASSAIRVSLGPTTTEAEIRAFLAAWTELYRKRARRAA